MTKNETRKVFEALDLAERDVARYLDISRGKLRKALEADTTPTWFRHALAGLKAEIDSGIPLEDASEFKNNMIGNDWTQITARQSVPILIEYAKAGKTLTYGELDEILAQRHPDRPPSGTLTKYSHPLGAISFTCQHYRRATMRAQDVSSHDLIPPITTIVVRKDTRMPGEGLPILVKNYLKDIAKNEDKNTDSQINFAIKKIFEYDGWLKLTQLTAEAASASSD